MAIPNTTSALRNGGPKALVDTRPGRTGVISSIAGVATLGFLGKAAANGAHAGPVGAATSMFTDPLLGKWVFVAPMMGAYALVMANELGYLDMLNRGDHRSVGQVMHDSTHDVPHNIGTILRGG